MTIDLPRRLLNVGGNRKTTPIPPQYQGFSHVLLDIDAAGDPDIVADARALAVSQPRGEYDVVYCSHNLEHYFRHDAHQVLRGFAHVLRDDGFTEIRVPDLEAVVKAMVERRMDVDDVLYVSPGGPITIRDVIYGHAGEIERSGRDWYAHKTGFTRRSLSKTLNACGFPYVFAGAANFEVIAYAFPQVPAGWARELLRLPDAAVEAASRQVGV